MIWAVNCSKMDKLGWRLTAIQILIYICLIVADDLTKCKVEVALPWEPNTYIPQKSVVHINCTAETSQTPGWSIQLPGRSGTLQFTFEASIRTLNDHGFYLLPESDVGITMTTIQLLINSTVGIDGTVVRCDDTGTGNSIARTILLVQEPTQVDMYSEDIDIQRVNISWNFPRLPASLTAEDINQTYTLTVTSSNIQPLIYHLHQPYYVFIAHEGAPPCEVYNFTATYDIVGVTYTVAGCSVPSPVLSRMLPSLPDISRVESSIHYFLEKTLGRISLNVTFPPPDYCSSYPVSDYILYVQCPLTDSLILASEQTSLIAQSVPENSVCTFSVLVSSNLTNTSTNAMVFYTTDVQQVKALHFENVLMIQCDFISGSDAQGCMVVLVGEAFNKTLNLTRCATCSSAIVNVSYQLSCFREVVGFDIESDGSIGTLAIPGKLTRNCTMAPHVLNPSESSCDRAIPIILGTLLGMSVIINVFFIIGMIFSQCNIKQLLSSKNDVSELDAQETIDMQQNEVYGIRTHIH